MASFISRGGKGYDDMAESAVRTDKRFQLLVYGALALLATAVMGISIAVHETSTIRWAATLLLVGILVTIAALALEL